MILQANVVKEYFLVLKINGKKIREEHFSEDDLKLIGEGLKYARTRDFESKRKIKYKLLLRKIMMVVKGEGMMWKRFVREE